jgi:hypothetical protein
LPCFTIRSKWTARLRSCSARSGAVMSRSSASAPLQSVEQTCMFQVSAVEPSWRPISAATIE